MSEQQPDLTPRPNRILAEPATPETCAADLRTSDEQDVAAGAARDQSAFTRMAAAPHSAAHIAQLAARHHDQGERR
jgi:hypothetical protein